VLLVDGLKCFVLLLHTLEALSTEVKLMVHALYAGAWTAPDASLISMRLVEYSAISVRVRAVPMD